MFEMDIYLEPCYNNKTELLRTAGRFRRIIKGGKYMEIQLWREALAPYRLAVDELLVKFNYIIEEHKIAGKYCPIEQVMGRVKSISSILEKAKKKNIPIPELTRRLEDIAGIRIICQFEADIHRVVDMIRNRKDMRVTDEVDYITHGKPSGYRSYHVIVEYHVQTSEGEKAIPVEIQIRTLAMNFWAVIEHSLRYKYGQNLPPHISDRLNASAEAVISLDAEMASIRDEILEAQGSFRQRANVVAEILNTLRSLYRIGDKEETLQLQEEFFRIYNGSDMDELERFSRHIDHIAQMYMAQQL